MKKLFALALALMMALSLCATAAADELDDIKAERKAKESATKDEKELNAKDLIGPDPDLPDGAPNFF